MNNLAAYPKLMFPLPAFRMKAQSNQNFVFDEIRKKYVQLTPEEWVRQHLVNYFINELSYPKGLIKLEAPLQYNQLNKRADVIVHDQSAAPWLLCECKSTQITLSQSVIEQATMYNFSIKCPYFLITNGLSLYCFQFMEGKGYEHVAMPKYPN